MLASKIVAWSVVALSLGSCGGRATEADADGDGDGDGDTDIDADGDADADADSDGDSDADADADADCTPGCGGDCGPGEWVTICAGTFTMGSPPMESCRWFDETQHVVTLTHDFLLLSTSVTQREFETVMGYNPSYYSEDGDGSPCGSECPAESLNWHEAAQYVNALSEGEGLTPCYDCVTTGRLVECSPSSSFATPYDCPGYRLPTEAEWEYAARSGDPRATYNGDLFADAIDDTYCDPFPVFDEIAWWCGNSGFLPHEVAMLEPNHWGLYDMLGNADNWCHDWYDFYPDGAVTNPFGPTEAAFPDLGVRRGGCWNCGAAQIRAASRDPESHGHPGDYSGLRPAKTLH